MATLLLKGRGEGGGYFNKVSAARPVAMPLGRFNHVMCSEARPSRNRYTVLLRARRGMYTTRLNPKPSLEKQASASRASSVKPSQSARRACRRVTTRSPAVRCPCKLQLTLRGRIGKEQGSPWGLRRTLDNATTTNQLHTTMRSCDLIHKNRLSA